MLLCLLGSALILHASPVAGFWRFFVECPLDSFGAGCELRERKRDAICTESPKGTNCVQVPCVWLRYQQGIGDFTRWALIDAPIDVGVATSTTYMSNPSRKVSLRDQLL